MFVEKRCDVGKWVDVGHPRRDAVATRIVSTDANELGLCSGTPPQR